MATAQVKVTVLYYSTDDKPLTNNSYFEFEKLDDYDAAMVVTYSANTGDCKIEKK